MPFLLLERARFAEGPNESSWTSSLAPTRIPADRWSRVTSADWTLAVAPPARCLLWRDSIAAAPPSETRHSEPRFLIAFDGFLSNAASLRDGVAGHASGPIDELELIARLLEAGGPAALDRLDGNYALCVIDPAANTVLAQRDRLGGRALYWSQTGHRRALATNSASLATLNGRPAAENEGFAARFLAFDYQRETSESAFAGVHELLPWQRLSMTSAGAELSDRDTRLNLDLPDHSDREWIDLFLSRFRSSVEANLGGHDDVAIMLSGGLDSGPTAVLAQERLTGTGRSLRPVSWTLPSHPRANEARWIERICQHLEIPLNAFEGDALQPFDELSTAAISPDLPFYNAFRPLIQRCYELAAALDCRVILNGNAGDLIYPPRSLLLIDQWRRFGLSGVARSLKEIIQVGGLRGLLRDPAVRHPIGRRLPFRRQRNATPWLTPRANRLLEDREGLQPPGVDRHAYPDYARQLLGRRMSFGRAQENNFAHMHGIERRDPFHNQPLVELMLQMPFDLSFREGYDKWIMRQAMIGKMPEVLRKKPRTGRLNSFFETGFSNNRSRIHGFLFESNRSWQAYVEPDYIDRALSRQKASAREQMVVNQCIGYALWRDYWEKA
ncbi:asparagine synthase-related protein [Wenzhouxiangella marina]|uniref:asparagine synthase (glutamine-hydrolyzing) n=1 Tax=Wenzhouxiangella marina TaxID=1579979 RepID=A0A0K0XYI1_9GAMM|nr:asparagine synthase-related protein [Wenzhouxiangella marina]AKS42744.1 hypothetical protein WM2015_2382 [Wenzhouxiangella marina]MBB6087580.1 asparagine synthase (glutamine-hydrolyzing) [Wenzhouxiangella marina]